MSTLVNSNKYYYQSLLVCAVRKTRFIVSVVPSGNVHLDIVSFLELAGLSAATA